MHNKFHKSLNASDYATGGEPGQIWGTMYGTYTKQQRKKNEKKNATCKLIFPSNGVI